jgi:hypothetical protein
MEKKFNDAEQNGKDLIQNVAETGDHFRLFIML